MPVSSRSFKPTYPMSPLISVIVPVFNVERHLQRCLDSILAQTYQNLEILIVDDGSTDQSSKICDTYAKLDTRIKVIHQANRGLSGARNSALKTAKGNYVTFVDSDDSIQPTLIETLLGLCRQYHTDISICSFREIVVAKEENSKSTVVPVEGEVQSKTSADAAPTSPPKRIVTNSSADNISADSIDTLDCLTRMLCEEGFSMSAWGKLYSRRLFAKVRFPEGRLYEDVGTTYRLVLQCHKIAISSQQLYNYYINPGSITQQHFTLHKLDLIDLTDKMCDDIMQWSAGQSPSIQLQLQNLTKKRRMHARFSVLRQMVMVTPPAPTTGELNLRQTKPASSLQHSPKTKLSSPPAPPLPQNVPAMHGQTDQQSFLLAQNEVVQYLRDHRQDILSNPLASRRDKIAMRALMLGLPVFRKAWSFYDHHKVKQLSKS